MSSNQRIPATCRRRFGRRRGATVVEFAIAAPTLLLVVFSAFEMSRMSMLYHLAQDAAYEACRFSMLEGGTPQEAQIRAAQVLDMVGAQNASIVINNGVPFTNTTTAITTRVTLPMSDNAFLLKYFFTGKSITAEITLNLERYSGFYNASN